MSVPLPGPRNCLCWSFWFLTWRWFSGRLSPAWQENKHRYAVQCWQNCQSKLKYKKSILFHRLLVDKLHKHIHIRSLFCVSDMTQNLKSAQLLISAVSSLCHHSQHRAQWKGRDCTLLTPAVSSTQQLKCRMRPGCDRMHEGLACLSSIWSTFHITLTRLTDTPPPKKNRRHQRALKKIRTEDDSFFSMCTSDQEQYCLCLFSVWMWLHFHTRVVWTHSSFCILTWHTRTVQK